MSIHINILPWTKINSASRAKSNINADCFFIVFEKVKRNIIAGETDDENRNIIKRRKSLTVLRV